MQIPQPIVQAYKARTPISGFYQSGAGNCASIAASKAALMAFVTKPLFIRTAVEAEDFVVVMCTYSHAYCLTTEEMSKAAVAMKVNGDNATLVEHAHFMFAAMSNRVQVTLNDGQEDLTFDKAIETLNDRDFYLEGPKWLGLKAYAKRGPQRKMPSFGKACRFMKANAVSISKSLKHAWFGSYGLCDRYGMVDEACWTISVSITLDLTLG